MFRGQGDVGDCVVAVARQEGAEGVDEVGGQAEADGGHGPECGGEIWEEGEVEGRADPDHVGEEVANNIQAKMKPIRKSILANLRRCEDLHFI